MDSLVPLPVDQESRMNIVETDYDPQADTLILAEPVQLKTTRLHGYDSK